MLKVDNTKVDQAIYAYCKRTGATRADLCDEIGIVYMTLLNRLSGKREWRVSELCRLASVTGSDFGEFFIEEETDG